MHRSRANRATWPSISGQSVSLDVKCWRLKCPCRVAEQQWLWRWKSRQFWSLGVERSPKKTLDKDVISSQRCRCHSHTHPVLYILWCCITMNMLTSIDDYIKRYIIKWSKYMITHWLRNLFNTLWGKCCLDVLNSFSGMTGLCSWDNPTTLLPVFLVYNEGLNPRVICWSLTSERLFQEALRHGFL